MSGANVISEIEKLKDIENNVRKLREWFGGKRGIAEDIADKVGLNHTLSYLLASLETVTRDRITQLDEALKRSEINI